MTEIRKYKPEDYMAIQRREFDLITFLNFPDPREIAENLANGVAFTGIVDGELITCGGIMKVWEGVGEAWIVSASSVDHYPFTFAKIVVRGLRDIIKELKLERVQTTVDSKYLVSQKWLEWMGFVNEGRMRKYINGRDFFRYALIKED